MLLCPRTGLGNGFFRLLFRACFQIAILRMLLCSEMLSCAVAKHFLHNSWPCLAFQRPSQPWVALFFLRLGHATVSLKRPGKLSNRSVRRDAPTVLREAWSILVIVASGFIVRASCLVYRSFGQVWQNASRLRVPNQSVCEVLWRASAYEHVADKTLREFYSRVPSSIYIYIYIYRVMIYV